MLSSSGGDETRELWGCKDLRIYDRIAEFICLKTQILAERHDLHHKLLIGFIFLKLFMYLFFPFYLPYYSCFFLSNNNTQAKLHQVRSAIGSSIIIFLQNLWMNTSLVWFASGYLDVFIECHFQNSAIWSCSDEGVRIPREIAKRKVFCQQEERSSLRWTGPVWLVCVSLTTFKGLTDPFKSVVAEESVEVAHGYSTILYKKGQHQKVPHLEIEPHLLSSLGDPESCLFAEPVVCGSMVDQPDWEVGSVCLLNVVVCDCCVGEGEGVELVVCVYPEDPRKLRHLCSYCALLQLLFANFRHWSYLAKDPSNDHHHWNCQGQCQPCLSTC